MEHQSKNSDDESDEYENPEENDQIPGELESLEVSTSSSFSTDPIEPLIGPENLENEDEHEEKDSEIVAE